MQSRGTNAPGLHPTYEEDAKVNRCNTFKYIIYNRFKSKCQYWKIAIIHSDTNTIWAVADTQQN